MNETLVNKPVFIHFRGLKLWYLRGFLPSDSAKCCKLQNFVRFLCSIFKRACFHMFLTFFNKKRRYRLKLNDRVARKKAGGRRREDSTQENKMMNAAGEELLHKHVYTQKLSRTEAFTHTGAFAQRSLYTERPYEIQSSHSPCGQKCMSSSSKCMFENVCENQAWDRYPQDVYVSWYVYMLYTILKLYTIYLLNYFV